MLDAASATLYVMARAKVLEAMGELDLIANLQRKAADSGTYAQDAATLLRNSANDCVIARAACEKALK
mgnify:CR=1 FL=1